jgi:hypothetical protein
MPTASVKTIGASGQLSLGKEHAGRAVLVEELEPGVWMIKLGEVVPDSERWLFEARVRAELDEALAWAASNPPRATDLDRLERELEP